MARNPLDLTRFESMTPVRGGFPTIAQGAESALSILTGPAMRSQEPEPTKTQGLDSLIRQPAMSLG